MVCYVLGEFLEETRGLLNESYSLILQIKTKHLPAPRALSRCQGIHWQLSAKVVSNLLPLSLPAHSPSWLSLDLQQLSDSSRNLLDSPFFLLLASEKQWSHYMIMVTALVLSLLSPGTLPNTWHVSAPKYEQVDTVTSTDCFLLEE